MNFIPQILFVIVAAAAFFLFWKKVVRIRRNVLLGREEDRTDRPGERWRNVALLALGQQKMFKRPVPAILHFVVYAGFVLINLEVLEILIDGIFGQHRVFESPLGGFYPFLIGFFEVLGALTLVAVIVFLIRRNVLKVPRLNKPELAGWPKKDANTILYIEVVLMTMLLLMNSAEGALRIQEGREGGFFVSQLFAPALTGLSPASLHLLERVCWWGHILGIFAFLNYLPYSKHFHIILAFPAAYYTRLKSMGQMPNMPEIQAEVLYAMEPDKAPLPPEGGEEAPPAVSFGARDVQDLSWKNLLDAYTCTECGRCSAVCPATITGKKLSPRKIMMDTRDRLEEVGANIDKNGSRQDDGKSLLHDYITTEELRACTTCQACVEACPIGLEPLNIIHQLRRNLIMEEGNAPGEWNAMSSNIENNMAPWKFSPEERDAWTADVV